MLAFLKNWTLLIAIVLGALLHDAATALAWMTPWLIFAMIFMTFCNISPRDLRFERLHLHLLAVQMGGSALLYLALVTVHPLYAQAATICVFMPTAAAAGVVTAMLGGHLAFTAAYTFLNNLTMTLLAPAVLPMLGAGSGSLLDAAFDLNGQLNVARQVMPVLLLPLLLAWFLQFKVPRAHAFFLRQKNAAFYLWALLLMILMGRTFNFLLTSPGDPGTELGIAAVSAALCALQFAVGKSLGERFGRRISAGQCLAQKNTGLGIWLCFQYLDPLTAVACAAYAVFQNIVNSFQIWLYQHRQKDALG